MDRHPSARQSSTKSKQVNQTYNSNWGTRKPQKQRFFFLSSGWLSSSHTKRASSAPYLYNSRPNDNGYHNKSSCPYTTVPLLFSADPQLLWLHFKGVGHVYVNREQTGNIASRRSSARRAHKHTREKRKKTAGLDCVLPFFISYRFFKQHETHKTPRAACPLDTSLQTTPFSTSPPVTTSRNTTNTSSHRHARRGAARAYVRTYLPTVRHSPLETAEARGTAARSPGPSR